MASKTNQRNSKRPEPPKQLESVQSLSFKTAREDVSSSMELPSSLLASTNDETPLEEPPDDDYEDAEEEIGFLARHPSLELGLIFVVYLVLIYCVFLAFPTLRPSERKKMKIPLNLDEAKSVANILVRYTKNYYWTVLSGFVLIYIFLQTFAIPGSIFLTIMSGFLFPFWTALFLVCCCSATGASCCYMLSWLVGRPLVEYYFEDFIRQWSEKVDDERDNLLSFIIFLRITPILPNWLINIVSPLIGVPLKLFFLGTFIGVAPPSIFAVQAGRTLNMLTSPTEHISWGAVIILSIVALASLIPVLLRRYI